MITSFVVAASTNNAIGKDNQLLWHLPNDMKFFKATTWGLPVIMGRKSFQSINSKPLPGRYNIVITRDAGFSAAGIRIAASIEEALAIAADTKCREACIIGGGTIYEAMMPVVDIIHLTRVHAVLEGDTFFPVIDPAQWTLTAEQHFYKDAKHAYDYSFQKWERK